MPGPLPNGQAYSFSFGTGMRPQRLAIRRSVFVPFRGTHAPTKTRHTSVRIRRRVIRLGRRVPTISAELLSAESNQETWQRRSPCLCPFSLCPFPCPSLHELAHPEAAFTCKYMRLPQ